MRLHSKARFYVNRKNVDLHMLTSLFKGLLPTNISLHFTRVVDPSEQPEITVISDQTKLPFTSNNPKLLAIELAKTKLLTEAFGIHTPLLKSKTGKPLTIDNRSISISHSGDLVTLAVASHEIGVDIQLFSEKMARVQHKFISDSELKLPADSNFNSTHFLWCAKEAIFKIYGENLAFKSIEATALPKSSCGKIGFLVNKEIEHQVYFSYFENFCFALAI